MFKVSSLVVSAIGKLAKPTLARTFSASSVLSGQHETRKVREIDDLPTSNEKRKGDELLRCKLASLYRLIDVKGWSWNIYNHVTVRCENKDHFLINPYGYLYEEITASSLLKIDAKCNVIEPGSTSYGLNRAGFTLHSTIHEARADLNAIIHIHTGIAAGMSTLKCGMLPISQEAMLCGHVAYHDYEGILVDEPMKAQIKKDLGTKYKILICRNHGVVFCGNTIEEAYFWLSTFMTAADIQYHALAAAGGNIDKLVVPPERVLQQVQRVLQVGVNEKPRDGIQWSLGEMEFEAELRRLDWLGYKTGYNYKTN